MKHDSFYGKMTPLEIEAESNTKTTPSLSLVYPYDFMGVFMNRAISSWALLLGSISAILGSGWLFSAYYTAKFAGPAAILAWLIGGGCVLVIAFVFAELSTMLPITASTTRIPQFTHGTIVSFLFSWMVWLAYAALAPAEVQAIMQYLSFYFPTLTQASGGLTFSGYGVAILLMLAVSAINVFSVRWLMRCNNVLTALKVIIPILISLAILVIYFSPHQQLHPANSHFAPFGMHGVVAAIASGGIVFAFNGFKQACELAGEAKNPKRSLPFAIIGSIVITLSIYLLLQCSFLTSLTHFNLANGWRHLHLLGLNSPMAAIVQQDHMHWAMPILYVGAIVGPLAAAMMYACSASRSLYGKSKNGYLPVLLQRLNTKGNPAIAIGINFIFGMSLFAPLPGWDKMITFLTSLFALTYAIGPIALLVLRKQVPNYPRPFKLPFATVWATFAFYLCTLMSYWSGWDVISKLSLALLAGLAVLFSYNLLTVRGRQLRFHWRAATWVWVYFSGLIFISYLGNFGHGLGVIPFGWDFVVLGVFCIGVVQLAVRYTLPAHQTKLYVYQTLHS